MGRCKYEKITHLEPVFDEVRQWADIKETKPGIFYIKSQGFMHFHEKDEKIWADVKQGSTWGAPIDIPTKITKTFLKKLLKEIKNRYQISGGC